MILQTLTIARTTFIEALRQPVLLIMILVAGVVQVFNTWSTGFAMGMEETSEVVGDNKLLLDIGLASVFVFGVLLAGFLATAVMSREIENKTVLTIVSKPVGRPVVVLGKFLGVAGAILTAMVIMLVFLLFCIRHGVMSTASDDLDQPVLLFALGATALALLLGAWSNFFYGWSFPQTSVVLLLPLTLVGYLAVLLINKKWHLQPLGTDFKPQITMACICLTLAVMVLTAVATCASTRLGQVMTIVVCFGVFVASLLSNHFVGRWVFSNQIVGIIYSITPVDPAKPGMLAADEPVVIEFEQVPRKPLPPGTPFYFGPSPSGFPLMNRAAYVPFAGDTTSAGAMSRREVGPAVIVTAGDPPYRIVTVRNIGHTPMKLVRLPEKDDYVFTEPTRVNYAAMAVWGALPNMHFYWLLDAISQNRPVSPRYFGVAVLYALVQIGAFLSLSVLLFQKRDVG
ncbi:MAG: ABC transporter permease [Phycisphaeraceae bacterium]|nr:ABC transporter permease [Phycisphaeraceae bacterium]